MTTTYATKTYAPRRYNDAGEHIGPGPWLDAIRAINGIRPDTFGAPTTETVDLLGGGTNYIEHYPIFDVVFATPYPDVPIRSTVRIVALTPEAAELLAQVD
jgi:hypothetical protein